MNDCIWCFIFCECNGRCEKYLSANTPEGENILEDYQSDIDQAIKPVKQKWLEVFSNVSI